MAYNWKHGKSARAVRAEADGKLPATRAARYARQTLGVPGCTAADIRQVVTPCEWHHSSKMYNRVDYYDTRDLREQADELSESVANRKRNARSGSQADIAVVLISFADCGLPGDEFVVRLQNGELAAGASGGFGQWSVRAITEHEHDVVVKSWPPCAGQSKKGYQ